MKFWPISKKSIFVQDLFCTIIWFVLSIFPFLYIQQFTIWWYVTLLPLLVLFLFFAVFYFPARYRNSGYCFTKNHVAYQTGVFVKRQHIVKRNRIVSVALICNPWTPILGIASITVKTTGTNLHIPYLPFNQAEAIVAQLTTERG